MIKVCVKGLVSSDRSSFCLLQCAADHLTHAIHVTQPFSPVRGSEGTQWEPMGANGCQWEPMGTTHTQGYPNQITIASQMSHLKSQ